MTGRVQAVLDWLRGRSDTALGRLALHWFQTYFEASRNSGCAATIYSSLSVLPAALVAIAYFHPTGGNANFFAERLVAHMKLTGSTATLVEQTFGSASANALAATLTGAIAAELVAVSRLRNTGWLVLVPAWLVASTAFWLLVPYLLLHRKIGLRQLLPGALLASLVLGGTAAFSPLFLAAPLNQNGKTFGSFGVVLTLLGYVFVLITLSLVCAVFSPVWIKWREAEKRNREGSPGRAESLAPS